MFEGDSADTCPGKFPLMSMGDRAGGLACADPGARTPIGVRGNFVSFTPSSGTCPPNIQFDSLPPSSCLKIGQEFSLLIGCLQECCPRLRTLTALICIRIYSTSAEAELHFNCTAGYLGIRGVQKKHDFEFELARKLNPFLYSTESRM